MKKAKFLREIHYFRAFAIICIIAVHVWRIPPALADEGSIYEKLISGIRELFLHDSTIYFIFVSGFLFYHLSSKFTTASYYISKFKNVASPYLILTSLFLLVRTLLSDNFQITSETLINYYALGKAQVQYWYIPFICIVFLTSPLLLKIPENALTKSLPFLMLLPLLGTRSETSVTIGQFIYFYPIYVLGVVSCIHYEKLMAFTTRYFFIFFALLILSSLLVICTKVLLPEDTIINFYESAQYIQKTLAIFVLLVLFHKIKHLDIVILDIFAKYSFALYFTHFILYFYTANYFYSLVNLSGLSLFLFSIAFAMSVTFITLIFCMAVKRLLGSKSRYIIGA